jgi:hypothetical protein
MCLYLALPMVQQVVRHNDYGSRAYSYTFGRRSCVRLTVSALVPRLTRRDFIGPSVCFASLHTPLIVPAFSVQLAKKGSPRFRVPFCSSGRHIHQRTGFLSYRNQIWPFWRGHIFDWDFWGVAARGAYDRQTDESLTATHCLCKNTYFSSINIRRWRRFDKLTYLHKPQNKVLCQA